MSFFFEKSVFQEMLGTQRVNGHTKNHYFAQKCPKIRFSHHSHKKTPFVAKKGFHVGFINP